MNNRYFFINQSFSLSVSPPSHSQSGIDCSTVTSFSGTTCSSLQAMKESDINPKSASVKILVFILINF